MVSLKELLSLMSMSEKIVVTDDLGMELHHGTVRDASPKKFDNLSVMKVNAGLISGIEIIVKHAEGRDRAGKGRTYRGKPCKKQEGSGINRWE